MKDVPVKKQNDIRIEAFTEMLLSKKYTLKVAVAMQ
jgi:hypothetical protein